MERLVGRALGPDARLVWTDNRSVYLSLRRAPDGETVLRLHRSFRAAPAAVRESVARFLTTRRSASLRAAREYFEAWLKGRGEDHAKPPRRTVLRPVGLHHDLREILGELGRAEPFAGLPAVEVTWGERRRVGAASVRLGTYRAARPPLSRGLIRVHPLLDVPEVPRFVVGHIVHHELAHHLLACTLGARAGRTHGADFRRVEELYPRHGDALAWLSEDLPALLLRARRRRGYGRTE